MPLHTHTHTHKTARHGEGGTAPTWGKKTSSIHSAAPSGPGQRFLQGCKIYAKNIKKKRKENETEIVGKTCAGSSSWRRGGEGKKKPSIAGSVNCIKNCKAAGGAQLLPPFSLLLPSVTFPLPPLPSPAAAFALPCPCLVAFPCVCRWLSAQRRHTRLLFYGIVDWRARGRGTGIGTGTGTGTGH